MPNVKVVLYGGLTTRIRGQETGTNKEVKYEFSPLNFGTMAASAAITSACNLVSEICFCQRCHVARYQRPKSKMNVPLSDLTRTGLAMRSSVRHAPHMSIIKS